jgi:precorrin-2 methylase
MAKLGFPGADGSINPIWQRHFGDVRRKLNAGADVATITTADATDLASAITLLNVLKARVNAIIAALNA